MLVLIWEVWRYLIPPNLVLVACEIHWKTILPLQWHFILIVPRLHETQLNDWAQGVTKKSRFHYTLMLAMNQKRVRHSWTKIPFTFASWNWLCWHLCHIPLIMTWKLQVSAVLNIREPNQASKYVWTSTPTLLSCGSIFVKCKLRNWINKEKVSTLLRIRKVKFPLKLHKKLSLSNCNLIWIKQFRMVGCAFSTTNMQRHLCFQNITSPMHCFV